MNPTQHIAMINKSKNIIPIIFEDRLDKGRYAIEVDEFTKEIKILERGTIEDNTYMYYCKYVQVYGIYVYLYTLDIFDQRTKFNINSLLKKELRRRKQYGIQYYTS